MEENIEKVRHYYAEENEVPASLKGADELEMIEPCLEGQGTAAWKRHERVQGVAGTTSGRRAKLQATCANWRI